MRTYPILRLAVGLALAACDESPSPGSPSTEGTLVVSTSSGGNDPDPDGYLLTVDGADSLPLDPAGTSEIDLPAGPHTLRLLGMAEHCSVSPQTPLAVDVPSKDAISVAFEVTCLATGVRITTTTTGLDFDPDGYRVEVDGRVRGNVPSNGTVLTRLDPGSRTIALTGLTPNCTIEGPGSRTLTIGDTEIVPIDFAAVCTATSGVIGVVVEASGTDVEGTYEAIVDTVRHSFLGPRGPDYLTAVPAGHHVVSLVPPVNCSVKTAPQGVTLTAGGLIRDTVEVTFSVTCRRLLGTLRVTAPTTGRVPANHRYDVFACGSGGYFTCPYYPYPLGVLQPNDTLIAELTGTYKLELRNIPANCGVQGPNPTSFFTVPPGGTVAVAFSVVCSP